MGNSTHFVLLNEHAKAPHRAHDDDAGFDLATTQELVLKPLERVLAPTGVAIQIQQNKVGMVCPRSGLAGKKGITVLNAPGIIDSGFTGEIKVILVNLSNEEVTLEEGTRIAQLVTVPLAYVNLKETKTLKTTRRGSSGFGSTGFKS